MGESSGVGFSTAGLQKGDLRYNVNDGITYQYVGGSVQGIASWRPVFGSEAYAQLINLVGMVPGNTNPTLITFDTTQEVRGMSIVGNTDITIQEKGIYCIVNAVQCGKTGGGGVAQFVDMWIRKNGVDIPNTGVRNTVTAASDTKVLVLNWVGALEIGDVIQKFIAVSLGGVGLGLYTLTNTVGAVIPAGIFTIMKIQ